MSPKISLEQWRAFIGVVDAGGYAQAAERLHKTQSSLSYLVQKLEQGLNVKVFQLQGRKAQLTGPGQVLYRRGRTLLAEAERIEQSSLALAAGWEAQIGIAVEILFPTWLLLDCMARFGAEQPQIRIELIESVLGGTDEALTRRQVDLAIAGYVPAGFVGYPLLHLPLVGVAAPNHPLHQLGRPLTLDDLRQHRQLVIRDSGLQRSRDSGSWLGAEQRWTVSNKATSIYAACRGLGFAWYAQDMIRAELERGDLKALPMAAGGYRSVELYLIFADEDFAGPGVRRLAELLREGVANIGMSDTLRVCPDSATPVPAEETSAGSPTCPALIPLIAASPANVEITTADR